MFKLSNEVLLKLCTPLTLKRGKEYYMQERVKSISFIQEKLVFDAAVFGTRKYNIQIQFDEGGHLRYTHCTCPAHENYLGICKHIAAVLLVIRDKDSQGFFQQVKSKQVSKQIFNLFQHRPYVNKIPIEMEITFEYSKPRIADKNTPCCVSLRIGREKLYSLRNIKKFFEAVDEGIEVEMGKSFTFDPVLHEFKPQDQKVLDLLRELHDIEKLNDRLGTNRGSLFKEKQVFLPNASVKRFFEVLGQQPFHGKIHDRLFENMQVRKSDFPLEFLVTKEDQDLLLEMNYQEPFFPITDDGEYFFSGDRIYQTSKKQQENFKPFYVTLLRQQGRKIRFLHEDRERFVSEILPFAEKAGTVTLDEKIQSIMEKVDIDIEIYLDRLGDTITAEVQFAYGDRRFNPFAPAAAAPAANEKIIVRDMEKERWVLDILGESEFKVRNYNIYLDEEDKVFDFIYHIVPKLQAIANVYYSESFKKTIIREPSVFSGGIRLNTGTSMLEFSFSLEGIEKSELAAVLKDLKANKRYHRLKDGTFLSLETREIREFADVLEYLDLDKEDLEKDLVEIPKYRAFYLDQFLKNSNLRYIERNHAFKEFVRNISDPEDLDLKIPQGLTGTLREYQKFGFKWLKTMSAYGLGGILADDMGLGKTFQVITMLLSDLKEKGPKPSIAIVPTSLIYNWAQEVEKFAPELRILIISGSKDERQQLRKDLEGVDLVITSYPLIRRDIDDYTDMQFRYCILDEAQYIKNPGSQNARAVKKIRAESRFALTGTPMENALLELWSIFDFVLPGYLFSSSRFSEMFEKPVVREEDPNALRELSRHIKPFILRRLKTDVLKELPEKIEHKMVAELTREQKRVYLAYLENIRNELDREIREKGFGRSQIKILAGLTRLRQICCHPRLFLDGFEGESGKMQLLQEIVSESLESGHRILLFSQFTGMLQIIQEWLAESHIEFMYLDGSTPTAERARMVKSFNEGMGKVFLISLKAGGTGLNLTGADTVIHYDPWWNPAVEDQATDRAYRIGQLKSVHVMKLITKGTIEEKIFNLQESKKKLVDAVIQPGETLLSKMSEEEFRALFTSQV